MIKCDYVDVPKEITQFGRLAFIKREMTYGNKAHH